MNTLLTNTQVVRARKETLAMLNKLVRARETKDLVEEVQLGSYGDKEEGEWANLFLTKKGLFVKSGYTIPAGERSDGVFMEYVSAEEKVFQPKAVKARLELVRKYDLNAEELKDLLAKLKAK